MNEFHKDVPVHFFKTYKDWLGWLGRHHTRPDAIWIKFAKKATGIRCISYEEAREGAIIYGWIDGLINKFDDQYFLRRFTQRRPKSKWSQINREIATELIQSNKMQASGLAEVEKAQQDGRWDAAYPSSSNIQVPKDLQKLLDENPAAREFFESISKSNRYAFLMKLFDAKRPQTREKRLMETIEMLTAGKVYHPGR